MNDDDAQRMLYHIYAPKTILSKYATFFQLTKK